MEGLNKKALSQILNQGKVVLVNKNKISSTESIMPYLVLVNPIKLQQNLNVVGCNMLNCKKVSAILNIF